MTKADFINAVHAELHDNNIGITKDAIGKVFESIGRVA